MSKNALEKLRRNSTLKTLSAMATKRAEDLHLRYGRAAGHDHQEPSGEDAQTLFEHWHDVATLAYHLRRLAAAGHTARCDAEKAEAEARRLRALNTDAAIGIGGLRDQLGQPPGTHPGTLVALVADLQGDVGRMEEHAQARELAYQDEHAKLLQAQERISILEADHVLWRSHLDEKFANHITATRPADEPTESDDGDREK
jgi:hypothetical protein